MSGQPDLFGAVPPAAYPNAPGFQRVSDTSRAAAESVVVSAAVWRGRVLEAIRAAGREGATADGIAALFGTQHNTTSPRVTELSLSGLIRDSGRRRLTRSGRHAVVWEVTT